MPRTKGETTKLVIAKTSSDSLRVTIPSFVVKSLHLVRGDELHWEIESLSEGRIGVTIIRAANSRINKEVENGQ
jgi:antitoxin component of MazEF toxin-antitoxin module